MRLRSLVLGLCVAVAPAGAEACVSRAQPDTQYFQNAESLVPAKARALYDAAQAAEARDPGKAVHLYAQAVKAGDGRAAFRLGQIYDKGFEGVRRDYAESLRWYHRAQELGAKLPGGC